MKINNANEFLIMFNTPFNNLETNQFYGSGDEL